MAGGKPLTEAGEPTIPLEICVPATTVLVTPVPPSSYFVMGDSRDNSLDSRYWGFVPRSNIFARALYVHLSFDPQGKGGGVKDTATLSLPLVTLLRCDGRKHCVRRNRFGAGLSGQKRAEA